ncbi:MAG TPA: hypothetical protein VHJ40_09240 [Actinomycetota bacterium]|nr:hypothetical protein [Actinomycetota bacterium]
MLRTETAIQELKVHIARRLSEYGIRPGKGQAGTVEISLLPAAERIFKAHWTGYRIVYPNPLIFMRASLNDGSFWSEGYISPDQPSWVLVFRKDPHPVRGTGGARPDDKFASDESVETAHAFRQEQVEEGLVPDEEVIRYEDFDLATDAIDQLFNYTSFYSLKAVSTSWEDFGYVTDEDIEWSDQEVPVERPAIDDAMEESLKKSDILWLTPDTDPMRRPLACWFVYNNKDKRIFVLSGEPQQLIPYAANVRSAHVVLRWKGRDARMAEFDADVRTITAADKEEFEEIARQLVSERESVRDPDEHVASWMRDGVILELIPRA